MCVKTYVQKISDIIEKYKKLGRTQDEIYYIIHRVKKELSFNPYNYGCPYVAYMDFMIGECCIDRILKTLDGVEQYSDIEDYKQNLEKASNLLVGIFGVFSKTECKEKIDDAEQFSQEFPPFGLLINALLENMGC
jgi:hypothetical protein